MGRGLPTALGGLLVLVLCAAATCSPRPEPGLLVRNDRPTRSQRAVDDVVGRDTVPGCSAAVGERGKVIWQGHRGLALVEPAAAITEHTAFDIGTISMQFTALSVALMAKQGRLSLDDTVAEHLDGYRSWAGRVTIDQLIHHTSGVPDIVPLMRARGVAEETEARRSVLLDALAEVSTLDFEPGTRWAYSDSNYLLLGAIVEKQTGSSLGRHLDQTFFDPLDLSMSLNWPGPADRSRSYRGYPDGRFEIADVAWEAPGLSGIRATPSELVRWGDVYRTGAVAGTLVTDPARGSVDGAYDDNDYGLGILIAPDQVLWHDGYAGGFHSIFGVSADREIAIAVTCNSVSIEPSDIAEPLVGIWDPR